MTDIKPILRSQYRASLTMLLAAIEKCPDSLWTSATFTNPYWQVAYHTLYYADLYLRQTEADFTPWAHHRPDHHRLTAKPPDASSLRPYSQAELLEYGRGLAASAGEAVDRLDLTAPDSGYSWYQMSKLEHQLVGLRHIHHHTGQLSDRLRQATAQGSVWVKGVPE